MIASTDRHSTARGREPRGSVAKQLSHGRRVSILCHSPLFAASIKALLEKEQGLEVFTSDLLEDTPVPRRLGDPGRLRQHVLIVEENGILPPEENAYLQDDTLTIISLSLKDNAMKVSYECWIPSADSEDLLRVVKNGGLPEWLRAAARPDTGY